MARNSECYGVLSVEEVDEVDRAGRAILERVGIRILDSTYLDLLSEAGAHVDYGAHMVRFEGKWLDEMLSRATRRFTLCSRDGENDIALGGGKVFFGNGGRVFRILDMGTGGYRLTLLRDVAHTAALVDHLDCLSFYIIACQAHDAAPNVYHLNDFYHAFNHTTKHVMGGCDTYEGVKQMWELSSLIAGGEDNLRERPFVSVITNPISPLTVEANTLRMLHFCVSHGIPVTCAPAPISGATAPATLAGTLAQMHAEALAGVALSQIFAPGSKVLYGAVPTAMDLRSMEYTMGSVEMAMMNAAAVKLAQRYDLPIYASAGVTESKRPDIQAGVEKAFSSLMVAMAGADCIHLAAGMLDSGNSISYEQYAIDNEIIGMIYRVLAGIKIDDDTLGLEVIEKVGPGGNYVLEDHTVDHMMSEFFYPNLGVRHNFDIWEEKGRPSMLIRAREVVEEIIAAGEEGLLNPDMIAAIREAFPGIQSI